MEFVVDAAGRLIKPTCHDGALEKVYFTVSKSIELLIRRQNAPSVWIRMDGLVDSLISLWAGVIVSEIFVWKLAEVPDALWSVPDSGWNGLFRERLFEKDRKDEARRITAANPGAYLFELQTSYGGSISCVAYQISISSANELA